MKEVAAEPDIMGDLREDIEDFYKRDHVEVVEEKEMVEHIFFTDLNFSHNTRVSQVRWHPTIEGMVVTIVKLQAWDKKYENFFLSNLQSVNPEQIFFESYYNTKLISSCL